MNTYKALQKKYKNKGLNDLRLRSIGDIKEIHNVNILKLNGYEDLTKKVQEFFKVIVVNFYNAQGLETREDINPKRISIKDGNLIFYYNNTFNYFHCDGTWG